MRIRVSGTMMTCDMNAVDTETIFMWTKPVNWYADAQNARSMRLTLMNKTMGE